MMFCIQVTFLNQESTRLLARARQAENGELDKNFNAAEMDKTKVVILYFFLHPEVRSLKGRLEEEGREGERQEETISRLATHPVKTLVITPGQVHGGIVVFRPPKIGILIG